MARRTSCASNLRQLGSAMLMYTQDHDETLPPYSYGTGPGGIDGYLGLDGARWGDMIYSYVSSKPVFNCPDEDVQLATFPGGTYFDVSTYSYGYTGRLFDIGDEANFGVAGRAQAEITNSSGAIMLADDTGNGEGNARITLNPLSLPRQLETQVDGQRHTGVRNADISGQALNAVYADGHVKWVRLSDTYGTTTPFLQPWTINAN